MECGASAPGTTMIDRAFVCPMPGAWDRVYRELRRVHAGLPDAGRPPPVPLILAGWAYSSDADKQRRWQDTRRWAEERGLGHLVPPDNSFPADARHEVPLDALHRPVWVPHRRYESVPRLTGETRHLVFATLVKAWSDVAGPVASATRPLRLAGKKGCRLVVAADPAVAPPWGSWSRIDPLRSRSFADLRRRLNVVVAPHMVDHIDFQVDSVPWTSPDSDGSVPS